MQIVSLENVVVWMIMIFPSLPLCLVGVKIFSGHLFPLPFRDLVLLQIQIHIPFASVVVFLESLPLVFSLRQFGIDHDRRTSSSTT
jgi:hypothetical protein